MEVFVRISAGSKPVNSEVNKTGNVRREKHFSNVPILWAMDFNFLKTYHERRSILTLTASSFLS
jgi:hypothetical protein